MRRSTFRTVVAAILALLGSSPSFAQPNANASRASDDDQNKHGVVTVVVNDASIAAWTRLQAADVEISKFIEQGRLNEISAQVRVIKDAIRVIDDNVKIDDQAAAKRVDSVLRQIDGLVDRLGEVAASGKAPRTATVYRNLHRHVEWAKANLPSLPDSDVTEEVRTN